MAKKKKKTWFNKLLHRGCGAVLAVGAIFALLSVIFFNAGDNALNVSSAENVRNLLGVSGAKTADFVLAFYDGEDAVVRRVIMKMKGEGKHGKVVNI